MAPSRMRTASFIAAGLALAFALAFFVSPSASTKPDGLNKVAVDTGIGNRDGSAALRAAPGGRYAIGGIGNERVARGLAGMLGVGVTFLIGAGLVLVARRTSATNEKPAPPGTGPRAG